jgi:tetratricopeptide (TPR) repeat protein
MPQRVSFCLIVKNEEERLARCLASAVDLVQETVVVDTGSTDRTKEIASAHGAKVFDFPWRDSFAAAMNESISRASGDWIFWLHADHWVDETNRERLRKLFASLGEENVAYLMKWHCPSRSAGEGSLAIDTAHLFRNHPQIRWRGRVHEQIRPAIERLGGTTRFTDVVVFHSGYADPQEHHAKLLRNLRLLELDVAENPTDLSMVFHLGWTLYLLGRPADAIAPLQRSLALCPPGQTILRKNYALLVRSLRQLWRQQEAFNICAAGRAIYPNDPELLFHEGQLRREGGDLAGAEQLLLKLLREPLESFVACGLDLGLKTYKGRCALAEVYRDQGRVADAEREWRTALAEQPNFTPAWLCLGDMWLQHGRWQDVDQLVRQLCADPKTSLDGAMLKARSLMLRKEFAGAKALLAEMIARAPQQAWPRELLAHALVMENKDPAASVQALKDLLTLDPTNSFALQQLPLAQRRLAAS